MLQIILLQSIWSREFNQVRFTQIKYQMVIMKPTRYTLHYYISFIIQRI
jgi:hypothetical protein